MEKIKLSVVIIAKNEEKKIARCLESVKWADEIVVVDGLSTDRTAGIAASFGAKVVPHEFTGTFADDRNIGLDSSRNDWVLQLDADEIVTASFKDKLGLLLAKETPGAAAYKFRRVNFFLGRRMDHGGFHHYIPNLVDRRRVRFAGSVHEVPVCEGGIEMLEADIEHHPFDSIAQFVNRQNRYSGLAAKEILDKRGVLFDREIRKGLIGKSVKIFWKSYVKKQGFREGMHGLVFAALFALINFLTWSKYWELVKDGSVRHNNPGMESAKGH